ncbi:MAG: J domain-containing protein [Blastocatellia bacterium]
MSDCWKILRLEPTADLAAIKRAYREQVKRFHPDTVTTPEQKRRYTIICAAINDAYREAVRQARAASATPPVDDQEPGADEPHQDGREAASTQSEFNYTAFGHHRNGLASLFKSPTGMRTLLLFFSGFMLLAFFVGQVRVPPPVETLAGILVALFIGFFIFGLLTAGAMDLLIFWFFPRGLLYRFGLEKYESKLVWLTILAANGAVFFFTNLIAHPSHRELAALILDITVRAAATVTVPLIIAVLWLRDLLRYRRVKQDESAPAESL